MRACQDCNPSPPADLQKDRARTDLWQRARGPMASSSGHNLSPALVWLSLSWWNCKTMIIKSIQNAQQNACITHWVYTVFEAGGVRGGGITDLNRKYFKQKQTRFSWQANTICCKINSVNYVCEHNYNLRLFNAHAMILIFHIFMNVNKLCLNQKFGQPKNGAGQAIFSSTCLTGQVGNKVNVKPQKIILNHSVKKKKIKREIFETMRVCKFSFFCQTHIPLTLQLTLRITGKIASYFRVMSLHAKHRHRIVLFYVCDI